MKLPKYWNMPDTGSPALAPGVSKSNSLEVTNAPFLTAAGPGFVTYKKDGFTKIILNGDSSTRPYLWLLVMRRAGGNGSDSSIEGYNVLCEPETGITIEFLTNVNNRGVLLDPLNPSKKAPMRGVFSEDLLNNGVYQFCVRVGGGWMLGAIGDGVHSWPVLFTFEDKSKNFLACTNVEAPSTHDTPTGLHSFAHTSLSALGWDRTVKAYGWAVGYYSENFNNTTDTRTTKTLHKIRITSRAEPLGPPCGFSYNTYPVITPVLEEPLEVWENPDLEYGVLTGDTNGGATKVVYYNSLIETQALGRVYPPETYGGKPFCVGPGRLMSIVFRVGRGQVPGTYVRTDPIVWRSVPQSEGTICESVGFLATDSFSLVDDITRSEFDARAKIEFDTYPDVDSLVFFSEDFGRSWARTVFDNVFPGTLSPDGQSGGPRHAQAVRGGQYYWACYIGEGKSLVFIPAADYPIWFVKISGDMGAYLQEPDVGCFLLEGTRATRLKWPGDTPGAIACHTITDRYGAMDMPATLGVGAYSCMTTTGELCITLDFGQTWSITRNAMPNAAATNPSLNPVVPIVRRPAVAAHVDALGHPIEATHARTMTVVPGEAIAQPAGSEKKLKVYEVTTLVSDETFAEIFTNGPVRAPGTSNLYPAFTDRTVSPTYCVYYGEPSNRERPRPELGNEFAKPKKPT